MIVHKYHKEFIHFFNATSLNVEIQGKFPTVTGLSNDGKLAVL